MPAKTIRVQTAKDSREIPAVWVGAHLAVHHPLDSKNPDGLSKLPRWWSISHVGTGYLAGPSLDAAQRDVIALAKLWDSAFASVTAAGDAKNWRWRDRWVDDLGRIVHGKPLVGPRDLTPLEELHSAGTARDVELAVRRAMGYETSTDSEAAEPFPANETMPADLVRMGDSWPGVTCPPEGWPQVLWRGKWWPVPTVGEVEDFCLGSVAETPDGRTVEPDHPEAWPRLLGLI